MDWRAHVRTALDGEHPVVGRSDHAERPGKLAKI
jgi:hypothetical protein